MESRPWYAVHGLGEASHCSGNGSPYAGEGARLSREAPEPLQDPEPEVSCSTFLLPEPGPRCDPGCADIATIVQTFPVGSTRTSLIGSPERPG